MANQLLIALVTLPLLSSVLTALFLRRSPGPARGVALVGTAATALCATALVPFLGDDPGLAVHWLPGTGPMRFGLTATGLFVALVTAWAAFLTLLGTTSAETDTAPPVLALVLLALSASNAAFLSEHFLARYVALEIVALSIALAPLIELEGDQAARGFWLVYVVLRLGDIGLLSTIKILFAASGTLEITPALEAASVLSGAQLGWVIFGLVLAVWVKLGNWPFHLWVDWGHGLSLEAHAWLFSIVMPNLGAYLLYRVTPLLAAGGAAQTFILWLAAGGAMLAVITALTRRRPRGAMVAIAAARGALLVFAAASGLKAAVWLGLLATTPLQLLLFLAGKAPEKGASSLMGRAAQGLSLLAGLALASVGLLITWWARETGVPLDALFVAEATVALLIVWAVREAIREHSADESIGSSLPRWAAMGTLALVVMVGGAAFRPLASWLTSSAGIPAVDVPTLPTLLRYVISTPALLLTTTLVMVTWQMQRRARLSVQLPGLADEEPFETTYNLQEGLEEAARALRAIVEVGLFEQIIAGTVRVVVDGARVTYDFVEQEGLEGLLRRTVEAVLKLSRAIRRCHTGLLRHNLSWIPVTLLLALVVALAWW